MEQQELGDDTAITAAATVAEFAVLLRRLHLRAGKPSFRELEKRTEADKTIIVLSRSTISDVLAGKRLPRHEFVKAFIHVCGVDERERPAWLATRAKIEEKLRSRPHGRVPWFRRAGAGGLLAGGALLVALLLTVPGAASRSTSGAFTSTITCSPDSCRTTSARLPLSGVASGAVPAGMDAYLMTRVESTKRWYIGPTVVPDATGTWSYEVGIGNPKPQDKDREFTICVYLLPTAAMDDLTAKFVAYHGDGLMERDLPGGRSKVTCVVAARLKQL